MLSNVFTDNFNLLKKKSNKHLNNQILLNGIDLNENNTYYKYPKNILNNENNDLISLININGYFRINNKGNIHLKPTSNNNNKYNDLINNSCNHSNGKETNNNNSITTLESFNNFNNFNNFNIKNNILIIIIIIFFIIYLLYFL